MPAKSIAAVAALLALAVSSLFATAPVPRKAPELKFLDPSGKEILLSSFGGKVVIIEFMLVKCPHCLRVAQMINKLNGELGPRGFQPVGIVFDDGINGSTVKKFVDYFKVAYTVGYTTSDNVDSYLGREEKERFMVPQIVVIDRKGVIRARRISRTKSTFATSSTRCSLKALRLAARRKPPPLEGRRTRPCPPAPFGSFIA